MQILFKELRGRVMRAENGVAGRVEDIFFDDRNGCVRHIVISTGRWPKKRRVVLDPQLVSVDGEGHLSVAMTIAEIQMAPHPDSCPPVSRQQQLNLEVASDREIERAESILVRNLRRGQEAENAEVTPFDALLNVHRHKQIKAHLRSVRAVIGYAVEIESGQIGKVADVWLNTGTWRVAHLSLNIDAMKRRVGVPLTLVRGISWSTAIIRLSAYWSHAHEGLSLESRSSPPLGNLRALGGSFRLGSVAADAVS